MKSEKGFALIELIIALCIIGLVSVPIIKSFAVSTKINVQNHKKDEEHIALTNMLEEIRKDPYEFIKENEDKNQRRYCINSVYAHYYYCDSEQGKFDDKSFKSYLKQYYKKYGSIFGVFRDEEVEKNKKKFKANGSSLFYDSKSVGEFIENREPFDIQRLSNINSIVYKAKNEKFYDGDWNSTEESNATYKVDIEVSRKAEIERLKAYNVDTLMGENNIYEASFMKQYLCVLLRNDPTGPIIANKCVEDNPCDQYLFRVFFDYTSEDLKQDLNEAFGSKRPSDEELSMFFSELRSFQNNNQIAGLSIDQVKKKYPDRPYFSIFAKHINASYKSKGTRNSSAGIYNLGNPTSQTNISARIDFDTISGERQYKVDVYNLTDKTFDLYIVHGNNNTSEVPVSIEAGNINTREVFTNRNIAKTFYKIRIKASSIKDKKEVATYESEKYVSGEEVPEFSFTK